jgi:hypothetical protein
MKTPLKAKRTDFSFESGVFDYAAIRKVAPPNPFGLEPDKDVKASPVVTSAWVCSNKGCYRWSDSTRNYYGQCAGYCSYG